MGASYSERASSQVPEPTKRRRDRILFHLQNADAPLTARTLTEQMRRNRMPDYSYTLCCKDQPAGGGWTGAMPIASETVGGDADDARRRHR